MTHRVTAAITGLEIWVNIGLRFRKYIVQVTCDNRFSACFIDNMHFAGGPGSCVLTAVYVTARFKCGLSAMQVCTHPQTCNQRPQ